MKWKNLQCVFSCLPELFLRLVSLFQALRAKKDARGYKGKIVMNPDGYMRGGNFTISPVFATLPDTLILIPDYKLGYCNMEVSDNSAGKSKSQLLLWNITTNICVYPLLVKSDLEDWCVLYFAAHYIVLLFFYLITSPDNISWSYKFSWSPSWSSTLLNPTLLTFTYRLKRCQVSDVSSPSYLWTRTLLKILHSSEKCSRKFSVDITLRSPPFLPPTSFFSPLPVTLNHVRKRCQRSVKLHTI